MLKSHQIIDRTRVIVLVKNTHKHRSRRVWKILKYFWFLLLALHKSYVVFFFATIIQWSLKLQFWCVAMLSITNTSNTYEKMTMLLYIYMAWPWTIIYYVFNFNFIYVSLRNINVVEVHFLALITIFHFIVIFLIYRVCSWN